MGFSEQGGDFWDDWGNVEVLGLLNLALVARLDPPADVFVHVRPPKVNEYVPGHGKNSFVSQVVMCVLDEVNTSLLLRN